MFTRVALSVAALSAILSTTAQAQALPLVSLPLTAEAAWLAGDTSLATEPSLQTNAPATQAEAPDKIFDVARSKNFGGAFLLGMVGSVAGAYLGGAAGAAVTAYDEDYMAALGLAAAGSALGSGILAGVVNHSVGKGIAGGTLGLGLGMVALFAADGAAAPAVVLLPVVQGLLAAAFSMGK